MTRECLIRRRNLQDNSRFLLSTMTSSEVSSEVIMLFGFGHVVSQKNSLYVSSVQTFDSTRGHFRSFFGGLHTFQLFSMASNDMISWVIFSDRGQTNYEVLKTTYYNVWWYLPTCIVTVIICGLGSGEFCSHMQSRRKSLQ